MSAFAAYGVPVRAALVFQPANVKLVRLKPLPRAVLTVDPIATTSALGVVPEPLLIL